MADKDGGSVEKKVAAFFSQYPRRSYPKGQILVFAGESPEYIFYLTTGRVREYDVSYRGDEIIVNIFKPGAFFPMSWAINRTPNTYFYKTDEATSLHIIPVDDVLNFIRSNPDVMFDLLSRVYKGVDGVLGRLVHLMSGTAKRRLIYELIIDCRRFGKSDATGGYELDVTEVDLAARSGLSRETVSREMRKLKSTGQVDVARNTIKINDIATLEKMLSSEL